jgi:ribulose-phosphate 3-epimerase
LSSVVSKLDSACVDYYHLDSIEDRRIFDFAQTLRKLTQKPFDLHLITSDPVKYWDDIRTSDISEITIQLESLRVPLFIPDDLRSRVGVALLSNRQADFFRFHVRTAPSLLLMTTTPGKSGGKFSRTQFGNIMRYRLLYPNVPATVDGGVTGDVASVLAFMGVSRVVSGSYIVGSENMPERVHALRSELPVSFKLDETILAEPELLKQFSLRIPEIGLFVSATGEISECEIKAVWLDTIGAKTVIDKTGPFSLIWVNENIHLEVLRKIYNQLETKPEMVISMNDSFELTGIFCLPSYKKY